jgi:HK97 family phage portal protein
MAIIRSYGALQRVAAPTPTWFMPSNGGGSLNYGATYAAIYRTQPNVRTVVDFLARNVAQLGLHVFRRIDDDDRVRLSDHEVSAWIRRPNPYMTRYRIMETLMQDLGIYFNAFWLKVRTGEGLGLVRLSPEQITVEGGIFPTNYKWTVANGQTKDLDPADVIHFGGYDPENPLVGLSPIETLRRILAEEHASSEHRHHYWRNAARIEGVIVRPKEAGKWTKAQRDAFKDDWSAFQGRGNTGKTPVLEDGMTWQATSHSAKDAELTATRKLTREECAAAYHVPLPMVGILEHATFSNIKEQHKHLYQDCVGPWLVMIEEQLEKDLVPEARDTDRVYLEFNIAEKLKGSFEEQMTSLTVATGGKPLMTQNEARSRVNLPSSTEEGTDSLEPPANIAGGAMGEEDVVEGEVVEPAARTAAMIRANHQRQEARLAKLPESERAPFFAKTITRWDKELADDLRPLYGDAADRMAGIINGERLATLNAGVADVERG